MYNNRSNGNDRLEDYVTIFQYSLSEKNQKNVTSVNSSINSSSRQAYKQRGMANGLASMNQIEI